MNEHSVGSHQLFEGLEAEQQGGTAELTSDDEYVTLRVARGHEAEDIIRDIVFMCDRLIHLIVRRDGDEWP